MVRVIMGDHPLNRHIGRRILEIRQVRNMTQKQTAECLGVSLAVYQKLERGTTAATAPVVYELSSMFDVPVSFFFDLYQAEKKPTTEVLDQEEHTGPTISAGPMAVPEYMPDQKEPAPIVEQPQIDWGIGLIKAALSVRAPKATAMARQIIHNK